MVSSKGALLAAMPGDFAVFVGVAPKSSAWYLRFYLDADLGNDSYEGRFDLTLPAEMANQYRQVVLPLGLELREQDAWMYYRSIGVGLPDDR